MRRAADAEDEDEDEGVAIGVETNREAPWLESSSLSGK